MKLKCFYITVLSLFLVRGVCSVDLTFKLTPTAEFPLDVNESKRYGFIGGGGFADFGIDLGGFFNIGAEFGYVVLPKEEASNLEEGSDKLVSFIPVGLQFGFFFFPFSRIELGFGAAAGPCISITNGKNHYAPWYRGFAEIGFRINPTFSIGANASWFDTQYDTYWGKPGSMGITAGLSLKARFDTNKTAKNVVSTAKFEDSVFPLFYSIYKEAPFGTLTIKNNESAEIKNVRVSFRAGKYTSSDALCKTIRTIRKRKSVQVQIVADWNNAILQFSEEGKIPGEIVVEYELLGKKRTAVSQVIVPVYNRNQMRWSDASSIASFISTTSQEVLEFSKVLVGISRNNLRSALNRNMQFAMYLYEGMMLSGIETRKDTETPYSEYHTQSELIDYIQYPFQTMQFKSGDVDEVGILFMALLESVGISSGFVPLKDDFIVCINLGIDISKTLNFFGDMDKILSIDDQVWLPLSMSKLREGFVNSWYSALKALDETDEALEFVLLADAWQMYPPAGLSGESNMRLNVNEKNLAAAVETDMARYITAEFGPKIAALQEQIKTEGASVKLYNQLGMLYVRAGMYPSAKSVYEMSAKQGSVSAMNNLGNICSLQKDFAEAKKWYKMALEHEPNNATALKNLGRLESNED